jgi:predicted Fe-Mo cluster-binding NifX family protein
MTRIKLNDKPIFELKPDVIVVYGMGQGGSASFQNAGVTVLKANGNRVKDVVASYKQANYKRLQLDANTHIITPAKPRESRPTILNYWPIEN